MRQPIVFGKYLLLERISVGGMAEVFKAKSFGEEGFEKILAIKRILPSMAEDEEFIQMFIDEAKISGQLSHPNIGQIYELGKIADSHFIAMEFVWGKDVLQIQNRFRRLRQKMPLAMAAYVCSRVCEGLDYAHRKKDDNGNDLHIIHRDVSPQNVLVSYAGEVKLIDFGIAKARSRSSKTQAGVLKGKFGYMSPEQVRGLPLDHRSDVFAAGTLLFEMATGERLFTGESDFATLEKVRNSIVPQPSKVDPRISPALESIILTALRRDPDERYSTAAELQEELTAFLMTQNPIFNAKTLATTMGKMFEAERKREEEALQHYLAIRLEDLESLRSSPAARREAAVSLLPRGRPLDDQDISVPAELDAPDFDVPVREPDEPELSADDLLEIPEEEAGSTRIYGDSTAPPATGPLPQPEPMAAEPTFIFNAESGQLVQLAQESTVIFAQGTDNGGHGEHREVPDQGPTVIFDAGLSGAVAGGGGVLMPVDQISGTMPVALARRASVFKDILIGVLVAMVLILGIVLWKVFSSRGAASPAATLVLTASPPLGAQVLVDGVARGTMEPGTPLTIKDLPAQAHQIQVRATGLAPVEQQVVLAAGDVKLVNIELPVSKDGTLLLHIEPSSSHVFLDGTELSSSALGKPLELRAGVPHEVRVSKDGYRDTVLQVELRAGERGERSVRLEPMAGAGSEKAAGKEGTGKEGTLAATAKKPAPGKPEARPEHAVRVARPEPKKVKRPGAGREQDDELAAGPAVEKPAPRKPEPKTRPERAKPEGKKSAEPKKTAGVEPKTTIKPEAKAGGSKAAGKLADETVGYLVANTVPWARVLVDGADTGKTTPVAPRSKIALKPGKHKVTFVVDGKPFHFTVVIATGEITRLIKKLPVE